MYGQEPNNLKIAGLNHIFFVITDDADQTGHGIWVIIGGCFIALVIIVGAIFLGKKILTYFKGISVIAVHQNIFVFNKMGYILILLCFYLLFDLIY